MPLSTICDPGCWEDENSETCGKVKVEPYSWSEDILSRAPGFSQDVSLRVVPGTERQHGIYWITFKGGAIATTHHLEGAPLSGLFSFGHKSSKGLGTLPPTYL